MCKQFLRHFGVCVYFTRHFGEMSGFGFGDFGSWVLPQENGSAGLQCDKVEKFLQKIRFLKKLRFVKGTHDALA